mmetsp:Transcript_25336/g.70869  ORF Transcript_25336/g.70869 Transcript_25336/m.70869 type:complete len:114 (-) Transcript_25336:396-737(-)|eukprot:CAMPEP_0117677538 /NCGR_PEP_ID=MMETSP0804-20121206/16799_1 /TAXON_ID=1074897 /ORGANISM="Tetraselmis astigmatica, Strain CCMP880" /LENGTH=113 /DNA_ID=CAMNT_0005486829 /DNA_START=113 /DNA_END=454 /DNA_ORIENTATION=+
MAAEEPVGGQTEAAKDATNSNNSERCVPYFDALWFCYSPAHQLTEYYRYGTVDNCRGHWSDFMNCLGRKTKLYNNPAPRKEQESFWKLRTPEEAAEFWKKEFEGEPGSNPASS